MRFRLYCACRRVSTLSLRHTPTYVLLPTRHSPGWNRPDRTSGEVARNNPKDISQGGRAGRQRREGAVLAGAGNAGPRRLTQRSAVHWSQRAAASSLGGSMSGSRASAAHTEAWRLASGSKRNRGRPRMSEMAVFVKARRCRCGGTLDSLNPGTG